MLPVSGICHQRMTQSDHSNLQSAHAWDVILLCSHFGYSQDEAIEFQQYAVNPTVNSLHLQ